MKRIRFSYKITMDGVKIIAFIMITSVYAPLLLGEEKVEIGLFSKSDLTGWKIKEFKNQTRYSLVTEDGKSVLKAESSETASAFYKEIKIDLTKTPILNWTWKIENILSNPDEQVKAGDDFPARIYLVFDSGIKVWRTKALNYVWSSNNLIGSSWPNPFSSNVIMKVLRSGEKHINTWISEKRNVRKDLVDLYGKDVKSIDGIAIMTDTDNSSGKATAYYGDIYFSQN